DAERQPRPAAAPRGRLAAEPAHQRPDAIPGQAAPAGSRWPPTARSPRPGRTRTAAACSGPATTTRRAAPPPRRPASAGAAASRPAPRRAGGRRGRGGGPSPAALPPLAARDRRSALALVGIVALARVRGNRPTRASIRRREREDLRASPGGGLRWRGGWPSPAW